MAKGSKGMLVPSVFWRNSEYFCASGKIQYRSVLLLKKTSIFMCFWSYKYIRAAHELEASVNIEYMNIHVSKSIPVASRDTNRRF